MRNSLPILLIAVTIGLFYLYISPEYKKIGVLQAERDHYDEILEKADELRRIRAELEEKVSRFSSEDLEKLQKMLPQSLDLVHLVLEVDNIALKNGIIIRDISADEAMASSRPEEEAPVENYKTLNLSFGFKTRYANLVKFLPELEKSLRIMDVTNVSLASDKETPSVQEYKMTIQTYWIE